MPGFATRVTNPRGASAAALSMLMKSIDARMDRLGKQMDRVEQKLARK